MNYKRSAGRYESFRTSAAAAVRSWDRHDLMRAARRKVKVVRLDHLPTADERRAILARFGTNAVIEYRPAETR